MFYLQEICGNEQVVDWDEMLTRWFDTINIFVKGDTFYLMCFVLGQHSSRLYFYNIPLSISDNFTSQR